MDPLLAARRLPKLAERAMRTAIARSLISRRLTPRALVDRALVMFERSVARQLGDGVRPALLFAERDRILQELRAFMASPLAARLTVLPHSAILAGRDAAPYDVLVRSGHGKVYAIVFRRLPRGGARLELFRRMMGAKTETRTPVAGVLAYDFSRATARVLLDQAGAQGVNCDLRAS